MSSQILQTKLNIPPVRPDRVARPRLLAKLNEGLERPLTLISAPPGFGKTTLAAEWLEQQPLPAGWYSLDARDNDLARFLAYLITALETIQVGVGRELLVHLRSRRQPPIESLLTALSNGIAAATGDFVLVLDDYHVVEQQSIHQALTFLLDQPPSRMHLVIASRADPPLPLARWRARGQLTELRTLDLRFSNDEAAAFLDRRAGLRLTAEQVAALDAGAEGWVAGLQLAALSMQGRQDVDGFIKAFTGSHHFILDYMGEEVLQRQSPQVQTFLLQTCILDQMCAALCDDVTGRGDSTLVLEQLERANLFLIPLDDDRQWYRYHHLFADLLRNRLQQALPGQSPALHRKASLWYERNGFVNEAVEHALAASDFERVPRLIDRAAPSLFVRSEDATFRAWLAAVPDEVVRAHPSLMVWQSAALAGAGSFEQAEARLAGVDDTQLEPLARGVAALMRATVALLRSDLAHAVETSREVFATIGVSVATPDDPQAEYGNLVTWWFALMLGEAQLASGKLHDAGATYRRAFEIAETATLFGPWVIFVGFVHIRIADLDYEWNELDEAARHVQLGLDICRKEKNGEFASYALITLAQIKQARGDSAGATETSDQALALGRGRNVAVELRLLLSRQVKILLLQNRIEDAFQVAREIPMSDDVTWYRKASAATLAHASVLIAKGEFDPAARSLEALCSRVEKEGETGALIECLALLALARQGLGDARQAAAALTRALELGESEGFIRTFADLGEAMRRQIADYRAQIEKDGTSAQLAGYLTRLLAAFPGAPAERSRPPLEAKAGSDLVEPLSEREIAVLRLIADGLSNQEIADRLVVALSTVKTHINNIYGKLGAGNRTQALARAREHNLL
ncbi:MAG: LuxR C-terminal-related transcriptional regulator [Chloroflexi bacterium]|nr:LuxR C-terminal-related transcriptional regulator [Chloroflexota bacterium]